MKKCFFCPATIYLRVPDKNFKILKIANQSPQKNKINFGLP
jgi:hypothetical protein